MCGSEPCQCNNGVDDVRDLRDKVQLAPVSADKKVYIIDEVHMLSQAAFNAFLKTLEEPPPYVKFILATTEVHKVPVTILSRVQRFDFKMIPSRLIAEHPSANLPRETVSAFGADLARLALVDVGHAAEERALQVAEGVAAHALDLQPVLHLVAQQVGQRAGARQLHVAVCITLHLLGQLRGEQFRHGAAVARGDVGLQRGVGDEDHDQKENKADDGAPVRDELPQKRCHGIAPWSTRGSMNR